MYWIYVALMKRRKEKRADYHYPSIASKKNVSQKLLIFKPKLHEICLGFNLYIKLKKRYNLQSLKL